jgi:hypothetical protein
MTSSLAEARVEFQLGKGTWAAKEHADPSTVEPQPNSKATEWPQKGAESAKMVQVIFPFSFLRLLRFFAAKKIFTRMSDSDVLRCRATKPQSKVRDLHRLCENSDRLILENEKAVQITLSKNKNTPYRNCGGRFFGEGWRNGVFTQSVQVASALSAGQVLEYRRRSGFLTLKRHECRAPNRNFARSDLAAVRRRPYFARRRETAATARRCPTSGKSDR